MRNLLIVGGAGFIGSHLVDVCLDSDCRVSVFDNFSTGKREFLRDHPLLEITVGEILDKGSLDRTIAVCVPDVVFHLAAIHHIPTCEKIPDQALRINVEGTQNVLDACAKHRVPRVIFASTGALYDPTNIGALSETSATKPLDIYGISKHCCEQLVQYYAAKNESEAIVARLFNTVGRRETNAHVIPAILSQLSEGKRKIKLGNMHPKRDYIHAEDAAEAIFSLSGVPCQHPFDIYNVGSGIEHSVRDIVESLSKIIGEEIEPQSSPDLVRRVDRPSQLANIEKINRASGWAPSRSLALALEEAWHESLAKARDVVEVP